LANIGLADVTLPNDIASNDIFFVEIQMKAIQLTASNQMKFQAITISPKHPNTR